MTIKIRNMGDTDAYLRQLRPGWQKINQLKAYMQELSDLPFYDCVRNLTPSEDESGSVFYRWCMHLLVCREDPLVRHLLKVSGQQWLLYWELDDTDMVA